MTLALRYAHVASSITLLILMLLLMSGCAHSNQGVSICRSLANARHIRTRSLPSDLMTRVAITPEKFQSCGAPFRVVHTDFDARLRNDFIKACRQSQIMDGSPEIDVRSQMVFTSRDGTEVAVVFLNWNAKHLLWNKKGVELSGALVSRLAEVAWPPGKTD